MPEHSGFVLEQESEHLPRLLRSIRRSFLFSFRFLRFSYSIFLSLFAVVSNIWPGGYGLRLPIKQPPCQV